MLETLENCQTVSDTDTNVFVRSFTVCDAGADMFLRLRPGALLQYLQEAGSEHAEVLGAGKAQVLRRGTMWVVARTALKIERLPCYGEDFTLLTWPGRTRQVLMPRHYELRDADGALLGRGVSLWLLVNRESRRMVSPKELGLTLPEVSRPGELPLPENRVALPEGPLETQERRTVYSELDMNGHMNNTCYINWADDLLSTDFHRDHALRSLWVEYKTEVHPEETVSLQYTLRERTLHLQGTHEGQRRFQLRADYE